MAVVNNVACFTVGRFNSESPTFRDTRYGIEGNRDGIENNRLVLSNRWALTSFYFSERQFKPLNLNIYENFVKLRIQGYLNNESSVIVKRLTDSYRDSGFQKTIPRTTDNLNGEDFYTEADSGAFGRGSFLTNGFLSPSDVGKRVCFSFHKTNGDPLNIFDDFEDNIVIIEQNNFSGSWDHVQEGGVYPISKIYVGAETTPIWQQSNPPVITTFTATPTSADLDTATGTSGLVTITPSSSNFPTEGWGSKGWGRRVSGATFFGAIDDAASLNSGIVGLTNSYLITTRAVNYNAIEYKGTVYPLGSATTWSGNWGGQDRNLTKYYSTPSSLASRLATDSSWPQLRFRNTAGVWTPVRTAATLQLAVSGTGFTNGKFINKTTGEVVQIFSTTTGSFTATTPIPQDDTTYTVVLTNATGASSQDLTFTVTKNPTIESFMVDHYIPGRQTHGITAVFNAIIDGRPQPTLSADQGIGAINARHLTRRADGKWDLNLSHYFGVTGNRTVTLTATNSSGTVTAQTTVTVP